MSISTPLELHLEIDVLTDESAALIVNSILEFLLYQRNQIPFVWKTFKHLIAKLTEEDLQYAEDIGPNFQLERQKVLAKKTKDGISTMKEVIRKVFQTNRVNQIRFLFGATVATPKEAYTIYIPPISKNHLHENHQISTAVLNRTLISLLTCESLYSVFGINLCPTNVYLECEMSEDICPVDWKDEHLQIFSKDFCALVPSCKDIQISLVNMPATRNLGKQCCKEMQIFEDISRLSINDKSHSDKHDSDCNILRNPLNTTKSNSVGWWEANTVVRGFKDKTLKGASLWRV